MSPCYSNDDHKVKMSWSWAWSFNN